MGRTSDAREKLLRVAFELIWQQSYGSVSVEDICKRAEVKKGSFYYFFPSKSDLAVAAYDANWQASRPKYDSIFSPLVPPLQRIEDYCQGLYERQKDLHRKSGRVLGCPFASVGCELSTQDEKIRAKAAEMFEHMCTYLQNALSDARKEGLIPDQDTVAQARTIFSLITGVLLQAKVKNDPEVLRGLAPAILRLIGASPAVAAA
jgi:TetR/AcrR family transcriptional repressor of nem operon